MKRVIFLVLVYMAMWPCPDANAQLPYAGYYKTRGGLPNVCARVKRGEPVTIAFLGGSITYNPGWREMLCSYLEGRWPNVRFRYIAAGIPSLGSLPHAFRLQRDVLDSGRVDLLFVEAAVNDRGNGTDSVTQVKDLEGIVRHARRSNPDMDIVLLSFADPDKLRDYEAGKMPVEVSNHELVARHYGLPSIDLSREVADRIHKGEFSWEHDFKDVHPSPFGQRLYFETMRKMLDSIFRKAAYASSKARGRELPEPLDPGCFDSGSYLPVSAARSLKGFRLVEHWHPSDGAAVREGFVNVPVLEAGAPQAELALSFTGTAVGMAVVSGPDAGVVAWSIDGGVFQKMDLYTRWSGALHLPWYRLFAVGLANGKHVLRLRIAEDRNPLSKGTACRIVHFFVNRPVKGLWTHRAVKYFISPKGDDTHAGTAAAPFRTISRAAGVAEAGDTIVVGDGVYRERVMPARGGEVGRPIVYMAAHQHGAIVKGSDIWTPVWNSEGKGIYRAAVDTALFTDKGYVDGGNPLRISYSWSRPPYPYKKVSWTLGQLFMDGTPLKEVSSESELRERDSAWWFNSAAGSIAVHLEGAAPQGHLMEITTRRGVFRPRQTGLGYIEVRGFVFEHCANQFPFRFWDPKYAPNMESGMVGTRGGHHWVIADNIIRHAKSIGLSIGASSFDNELPSSTDAQDDCGYDRITGNLFYANGSDGIMGLGHTGVTISGNIFVENNCLENTTYEDGCIKTHFARDLLIEKNWFVNNETKGVWLDNTWTNCRITGNVFAGNRGYDVFFELDSNNFRTPSLADHNIFLGGREGLIVAPEFEQATANAWDPWSCGIYSHDADGVLISNNLFAKEGYGIYSRDIPGRRGTASYRKIFGNMFVGKGMISVSYPVDFPPYIIENYFYDNVYPVGAVGTDPFVLHGYFGATRPNLAALDKILRLWKENGGVGDDPSLHGWGPRGKPWGYALTMDQWQHMTGYDKDSRQMDIGCVTELDKGRLVIEMPEDMPAGVGPFEGLKKGRHVLDLGLPDDGWFREYLRKEYGRGVGGRVSMGRAWHIAVTGDDGNDGTMGRPFRTISKGAEMAQPGDTVLVHGGVYRERVAPPRGGEEGKPIVYMAAVGEKVFVKGSDVWKPEWKMVDGVYLAGLGDVHFEGFNPYQTEMSMFELMASSSFYKDAVNHQRDAANNTANDIRVHATEKYTLGQVFVNGRMLTEMLNKDEVLQKKGSWAYIKKDSSLAVNFPEGVSRGGALVELTTRNRIFAPHLRGLGYIQVRGFIFEHCANDAICLPHMVKDHPELATGQQGAVSTRSGHHWVIEGNTIRLTKTVGMDVGSESTGPTMRDYEAVRYPAPPAAQVGYHLIRNNVVSDNGIAGIVGIVFRDTRILNNTVERNNLLLYTGQQHAGIKVLLCPRCEVSGNVVRDNECFGIWLDNQVNDAVVRDNVVLNNTRSGIFYEIGKGPVRIEHNVVGNTRRDIKFPFGSGILLSDASGITVRDNTIFNNDDVGLRIRLIPGRKSTFPTRSGFTEAREMVIAQNRFYGNTGGFIEMPYKGSLVGDIRIDSNAYSGRDIFRLSASGEVESASTEPAGGKTESAAGKDGEGQKKRIQEEYGKLFRKSAMVVDSSRSAFRWSIGLSWKEWRAMTGEDGHSELGASPPNIVYIMADDLGYGDLHCFNKEGKIPTPNIDALAAKGVLFSNAHSADALCTPSRYSVLTGRYCWRSKLKKGVIFDYSQPLIEDSIRTIAQFLRDAGYHTAAFGKWHQGFDWRTTDGKATPFKVSSLYLKNIDFKRDFRNGPLDHGFDYYFGIPGSNDMGPYCYIENRRVVGTPEIWATKTSLPLILKGREGWMVDGYKLSQLDSNFTERAKRFIRQQDKTTPFFVYFAASAPHFPYDVPAYAKGKSGAGARGDMIYVFDRMVGELVKTLKEQGVYENTVIIITSDNGPLPGDCPGGMPPEDGVFETYGHRSMGELRGFKGNVFEGGHRVPLIISWPGRAVEGRKVEQEVCLVDIFGVLGQIVHRAIPHTAMDSYGFLSLVTEGEPSFRRPAPIISYAGGVYSVQDPGGWKYVHENKLGGGIFPWKAKGIVADTVGPVPGSQGMLFNLKDDPGERHDLYGRYPEKVRVLSDAIRKIILQ